MITSEDIAEYLLHEPADGRYELLVRAGYRYEHPFRRAILGVMPLVPVDDNVVISVYVGGSKRPAMQAPAVYGASVLIFAVPFLVEKDEEIYVVIETAEPPHRSYTGAAVVLLCQ